MSSEVQQTQPRAFIPFLGQRIPAYVSSQTVPLRFNGREFFARAEVIESTARLQKVVDEFAEKYLRGIIDREIAKLRNKTILVGINYKQGNKNFVKNERVSINSYLKKIGFSQKIDYQIGSSKKEWGINKLAKGKKEFVLFFNQDLVKYDSGEHIAYVVAHELAHVFHRDHGPEFQKSLGRLYSKKSRSEAFFKDGIRNVFRRQQASQYTSSSSSNIMIFLIFLILSFMVILILFQWLNTMLVGLNQPFF